MVICWERADLLALVDDVYCIFVSFPCGIFGQVWYLIVTFPDLCLLSYFATFSELIHIDINSTSEGFHVTDNHLRAVVSLVLPCLEFG